MAGAASMLCPSSDAFDNAIARDRINWSIGLVLLVLAEMTMAARRVPKGLGVYLDPSRRVTKCFISDSCNNGLVDNYKGNPLRSFSSASGGNGGGDATPGLHPTGLGLSHKISPEVMQTIRALSEVSVCLPDGDKSLPPKLSLAEQISSLKRAEEIFQQFGTATAGGGGSNDHLDAVRMMLADRLSLVGKFDETAVCIESILNVDNGHEASGIDNKSFELNVALAKVQFYDGGGLISAAERAVDIATEVDDASMAALRHGVAMNALALAKLACMAYADESSTPEKLANEVDECREMLSMATSVLKKPGNRVNATLTQSFALAEAASFSNQGIAEVLYHNLRSEAMGYDNVSTSEHALKCWNAGLNRLELGSCNIPMTDIIRSRLHSNIAMTLLGTAMYDGNRKIGEEDLKIASENASKSLRLLDGIIEQSSSPSDDTREALRTLSGRSLRLVAECYARGGSAVTAEGLYQSALDLLNEDKYHTHGGPLSLIERREVYTSYAALCADWEKRSRDADNMKQKAEQLEEQIVGCWHMKPSAYSGLWLFSMSDLNVTL